VRSLCALGLILSDLQDDHFDRSFFPEDLGVCQPAYAPSYVHGDGDLRMYGSRSLYRFFNRHAATSPRQ